MPQLIKRLSHALIVSSHRGRDENKKNFELPIPFGYLQARTYLLSAVILAVNIPSEKTFVDGFFNYNLQGDQYVRPSSSTIITAHNKPSILLSLL